MGTGREIWAAVVLVGFAALAAADEPRKPGATGVSVPGASHDLALAVLSNKRLQEELKLTPVQREKLTPLAGTLEAAQKTWMTDRRTDKDKATTAYRAVQAESKKGVEALLKAEQARRLTQIERRVAGPSALLDETNAGELKLTEEQRGRVRAALRGRSQALADARRVAQLGIIDTAMQQTIDRAATAAIEGVLSDGQKQAWKELLGDPFETTGFSFQPLLGVRK
jgi:hypothetical protein